MSPLSATEILVMGLMKNNLGVLTVRDLKLGYRIYAFSKDSTHRVARNQAHEMAMRPEIGLGQNRQLNHAGEKFRQSARALDVSSVAFMSDPPGLISWEPLGHRRLWDAQHQAG